MKTVKSIITKSNIVMNMIIEYSLNGRINLIIILLAWVVLISPPAIILISNTYQKLQLGDTWQIILSFAADLLGILTVTISIAGFLYQRNNYQIKMRGFRNALVDEIQRILPIFEKVKIDLDNPRFIDFALSKLGPSFVDDYDKYESIDTFEQPFYNDLSYFIHLFYGFEKYKLNIIKLLVFQSNFKYRKTFIEDLKNQDNPTDRENLFKGIDFYLKYVNEEEVDLNEKFIKLTNTNEEISNAFIDIIKADNSTVNNLFEKLKVENLENKILSHVLDKTYSVVAITKEKNNRVTGPAIIVKNGEGFKFWWDNLNEEIKKILKAEGKNEEEVEKYNIQNQLKTLKKDLHIQPFSYALKQDIYIKPVLEFNLSAPLFLIDCENLPIIYRNNPVKYMDEVVKKNAQKHFNNILAGIKKLQPKIKDVKKELILDYEILPFDLTKLIIRTRPDKSPRAFEELYISGFMKSENRKGFVKAHVLQIKRVLSKISPIGLVFNSCDQKTLQKLTDIEIKILKELSNKKNKEIIFEGIDKILENEHNEKTIKKVFFDVCKKNGISLNKSKISEIVDEIFKNAKLIKGKLK